MDEISWEQWDEFVVEHWTDEEELELALVIAGMVN